MLFQPKSDTLAVEPVLAGQHRNLVSFNQIVDADGALGFALTTLTKHFVVKLLLF